MFWLAFQIEIDQFENMCYFVEFENTGIRLPDFLQNSRNVHFWRYSHKQASLLLHLEFSLLKIRRYYEQTLEELKERHIREVESIKAQQRVQFDRNGTHAHSRFPTSSRLPYSSFESNNSGMDAQRYVIKNNY